MRTTIRSRRWRAWFDAAVDHTLGRASPGVAEVTARLRRVVDSADLMERDAKSGSLLPPGVCSIVSLGVYDGELGELVAHSKYAALAEPWPVFGEWLGLELLATAPWIDRHTVVVPVPSPCWRRWHRGIDHADLLARAVARSMGVTSRRLLRSRWRPPQALLDRQGRTRIDGSIDASIEWHLECMTRGRRRFDERRHVVLVDDVCTTGATLAACAAIVRRLGYRRVHAAVVCRSKS